MLFLQLLIDRISVTDQWELLLRGTSIRFTHMHAHTQIRDTERTLLESNTELHYSGRMEYARSAD